MVIYAKRFAFIVGFIIMLVWLGTISGISLFDDSAEVAADPLYFEIRLPVSEIDNFMFSQNNARVQGREFTMSIQNEMINVEFDSEFIIFQLETSGRSLNYSSADQFAPDFIRPQGNIRTGYSRGMVNVSADGLAFQAPDGIKFTRKRVVLSDGSMRYVNMLQPLAYSKR